MVAVDAVAVAVATFEIVTAVAAAVVVVVALMLLIESSRLQLYWFANPQAVMPTMGSSSTLGFRLRLRIAAMINFSSKTGQFFLHYSRAHMPSCNRSQLVGFHS